MQALGCLGNVLWFFPFGLGTGLLWCIAGVFCFISIIGIPFAWQHVKLAALALCPIGKTIVDARVADAAEQAAAWRQASGQFRR